MLRGRACGLPPDIVRAWWLRVVRCGAARSVAVKLLRSVLSSRARLDSEDITARLLTFLAPLVRDEDDTPTADDDNSQDFVDEQRLMARLVHLMRHDDTDKQFRIYGTARRFFGHGTARRIQHTLVPLVFRSLDLAKRVRARERAGETMQFASRRVFQFIHEICTALASSHPEVSLGLFVQSGQAADACEFDPIAYEFFTQAFILYEDLVDSKVQVASMTTIISTLHQCCHLEQANYENLIMRATQYAAKLLKKPDQCRMVCMCAQLFWKDNGGPEGRPFHHPREVLECLQRSLKIADVWCVPESCSLFVHILNMAMFFFERRCTSVRSTWVQGGGRAAVHTAHCGARVAADHGCVHHRLDRVDPGACRDDGGWRHAHTGGSPLPQHAAAHRSHAGQARRCNVQGCRLEVTHTPAVEGCWRCAV